MIRPGPSGYVYLTDQSYESGIAAASALALVGYAIECRCSAVIEVEHLEGPRPAHALYSLDGVLIRPGGGAEYRYRQHALSFHDPPDWTALEMP